MSLSYLGMAEESINIIGKVSKSNIWTATTAYYIFYYSLYSLMLKVGIKCEIHSCSLEFMKEYLSKYYSEDDLDLIKKAFSARIDLQYYANRPVNINIINKIKTSCKDFYIKTKDILANISDDEINKIRENIENNY